MATPINGTYISIPGSGGGGGGSSFTPIGQFDARLTLSSGVPVTTADVTAATTVYLTPFKGDQISLYDGSSSWSSFTLSEISLAVPATTTTMYDIFVYDNVGTLTLDATAWTNDTTRATALVLQNGVLVKSGQTERRYVGSFRTTGVSGQTEDSATSRFLWNYYNRVTRFAESKITTVSWTYNSAVWRAANNNTTVGQGRVEIIVGVSEDVIAARATSIFFRSGGSGANFIGAAGIGIDSTSTNSAFLRGGIVGSTNTASVPIFVTYYKSPVAAGYHFVQSLESVEAGVTSTIYGRNAAADTTGLQVEYLA